MSYDAPFAGLKVIDLSQGIAGPYCAMLLAQHGAHVIKVESIGEGDWARALGVRYGSHTAFSIIGNLGKRSIAVDPRSVPLGAPVFMATTRPNSGKPLNRLMLAQDTGSAIKGAVRADFFWGFGKEAGEQAGRMKQAGRMWLLLPPETAPK